MLFAGSSIKEVLIYAGTNPHVGSLLVFLCSFLHPVRISSFVSTSCLFEPTARSIQGDLPYFPPDSDDRPDLSVVIIDVLSVRSSIQRDRIHLASSQSSFCVV